MDNNITASTSSDLFTDLPYLQLGGGFVIGLAVGYALKKSFKILILLLGLTLIGLFTLEHHHLITINDSGIEETVSAGTDTFKNIALFLKERLVSAGFAGGGSAVGGFLMGLKIG